MGVASETLEQVFRQEYGRIIATLIRLSGSFDLAEESLQEAFTSAVARWDTDGTPRNPAAWLTTVAHRKLLDAVRREKIRSNKQPELKYETERLLPDNEPSLPEETFDYPDDLLRLIFTCCHPALSQEAQVALTLKTVAGLTTTEIARAFLVPEATLAQRLVRAKNKIRLAEIPYQVPAREILTERLTTIQAVVYLIFNEGYSSTAGDNLIRKDLCAEAICLGRMLTQLLPEELENPGLLALMLLHDSRTDARIDEHNELVALERQDRSLWDQNKITEGVRLVETILPLRRVGSYQLQAAIAAVHAEANTASETDWPQIVALYNELTRINRSPVVALNQAVAISMSEGLDKGLAQMEEIGVSGRLNNYYLFHAARADLLRRLKRFQEARMAYERALDLTTNSVERRYIQRRLTEVTA